MTTTNYRLGEKASVLFSGGTDSTLAAYLVGCEVEEVTLLTFDPGFIFFLENAKRHVPLLEKKLGPGRVKHVIQPIRPLIDKILLGDKKGDWDKYGFNLTALVCLGCRLAMHAAAIIYNLENGIPVIADGSIEKQSTIPEQLESFVLRNRHELWGRFGIRHFSPIYREPDSDRRLDDLGLSLKPQLKQQFVLFDSQPTCPFGVPADVYARLFYGAVSGPAREVDTFDYSEAKRPLVIEAVRAHFAARQANLDTHVAALEALSDHLPKNWEEVSRG